jgi:hypothetical protein
MEFETTSPITDIAQDTAIGFDQAEPDYIYIFQASDPSNVHKILYGSSLLEGNDLTCISPYLRNIILSDTSVINNQHGISLDKKTDTATFNFIAEYLNTYASEAEPPAPDQPLHKESIPKWLENETEAKLFGKYRNMDDTKIVDEATEGKTDEGKDTVDEDKLKINIVLADELLNLINYANYLLMHNLTYKLSALVANAVKDKHFNDIKQLVKVNEFTEFTKENKGTYKAEETKSEEA